MKRSTLGAVALGLGASAVAGYGAAMGRDAWRATKKGSGPLILLAIFAAAIALPLIGGRNITRGYAGNSVGSIVGGVFLIIGGGGLGVLGAIILSAYGFVARPDIFGGTIAAASTVVGLLFGIAQRPARKRVFAIAEANERFLEEFGFEEVAESEVTYFDGEGNPLRLMERTDDNIVFMAVGRRNRRAFIRLSPQGEMLGYTGVIGVTDRRQYRDPSGALVPK
jgi:hypothetical protein